MNSMKKDKSDLPTNSLLLDRKKAFAELLRAYLKFNVPSATKVEVDTTGDVIINDKRFKFDVSDYTGSQERYIFMNPSSGRIVIQNGDVKKIYKLDVGLYDE